MLALLVLIIIAGRMPCFHTLGVLGSVWKSEQLLLELSGDVDTGEVGPMCSNTNFMPCSRVTQKDTLLCRAVIRVHTGKPAGIAASRIYGEGPINITACLVKLNCLPSIFCRLTDTRTFSDAVI